MACMAGNGDCHPGAGQHPATPCLGVLPFFWPRFQVLKGREKPLPQESVMMMWNTGHMFSLVCAHKFHICKPYWKQGKETMRWKAKCSALSTPTRTSTAHLFIYLPLFLSIVINRWKVSQGTKQLFFKKNLPNHLRQCELPMHLLFIFLFFVCSPLVSEIPLEMFQVFHEKSQWIRRD